MTIHPASGEIYVTGRTLSANLPGVVGGIQATASGQDDGFVARLSADLRQRLQATYLGSSGSDDARGIAIHPASGEVVVVGYTDTNALIFASATATVIDGTATSLSYGGGFDTFVARLSSDLTAVNRTPNPVSFIAQSNVPPNTTRTSNEVPLIITPTPPDNQQTAYVSGASGSQFCVTNTPRCCGDLTAACLGGGFTTGWITGPYQFLSGDRVAVRHVSASPSGTATTNLIVGGVAMPFRTSTGNARFVCNLDANTDGKLVATVEGLILLRAMLGLSGDAIVLGTGVTSWEPYRQQLNNNCGTNFPF